MEKNYISTTYYKFHVRKRTVFQFLSYKIKGIEFIFLVKRSWFQEKIYVSIKLGLLELVKDICIDSLRHLLKPLFICKSLLLSYGIKDMVIFTKNSFPLLNIKFMSSPISKKNMKEFLRDALSKIIQEKHF